jgi:hypothetical protein
MDKQIILQTSSFSNVDKGNVGKAILERVFKFRLKPLPNADKGSKEPDFVQFDDNNNVDILVELKGWEHLQIKHFSDLDIELKTFIKSFNPRIIVFLAFHFIEDDLNVELTKSIKSFAQREDFEFRIYDIYWITQQLKEYPDIEEKYFRETKLSTSFENQNFENPKKKLSSSERNRKIKEIRHKILITKNQNFWWINATNNWVIEDTVIGETISYSAKGNNGRYKPFAKELKQGDLSVGYQGTPENCVKGIFEVAEEVGISDNVKLKLLYPFKIQPTYEQLKTHSLFRESSLGKTLQGSFKKLTYPLFNLIINATELGKIEEEFQSDVKTIHNQLKTAVINNDSAITEIDLLGFENDIRAFGSIIALKETKPPLAFALLGNWGTGKSFFMHKLEQQIEYLSLHQGFQEEEVHRKEIVETDKKPYCEGIVQIRFNAWSYLDANLWAGLVVNIFEKLDQYITDSSKGEFQKIKAQTTLSEKLTIVSHEKEELVNEKSQLKQEQERIEEELNILKSGKNDLYQGVIKKSIDDLIKEAKEKTTNLTIDVRAELEKQGITAEKIEKLSPSALFDEATSWISFIRNLGKFNGKQLGWFIVIFFGVLILWFDPFGIITEKLQLDGAKRNIIAFIGIIAPIFHKFYSSFENFRNLISPLTEYKNQFNKSFEETKLEYEKTLSTLEKKMSQKEVEINKSEIKLAEVNRQIDYYNYALKYSLTKRAFCNFIQEKAHDPSYQNYLGLISIIRRDFEVLSELFEEIVIPIEISEKHKQKLLERKKESDEFKDNFTKPLDRIVLYIDDLDRCPDEKVMEVLQAVHLLMAYPLFIVMVGVDKRCVYNALNFKNLMQYSRYTETKRPEELEKFGIKVIQPYEYLEKIFQIPFHLKEATNDEIEAMIDNLLQDQIEKTNEIQFVEDFIKDEANQPEKKIQSGGISLIEFKSDFSQKKVIKNKEIEHAKVIIRNIKPEDLKISEKELEYLKSISWLVGHTPRTIKRFINIYRIIRVHEELSYDKEKRDKDFLTIMFILGFSIGSFMNYAEELFDKLENKPNFKLSFHLVNSNIDLNSIKNRLYQDENLKQLLDFKGEQFDKFIPFIKRFSFGPDDYVVNLHSDK